MLLARLIGQGIVVGCGRAAVRSGTARTGVPCSRVDFLIRGTLSPARGLPVLMMVLAVLAGGCAASSRDRGAGPADVETGTVRLERIQTPEEAGLWEAGESRVGWEVETYRLQPGDQLDTHVLYHPDLEASTIVLPDGTVSLPAVGQIQAAGRTLGEFEDDVEQGLKEFIVDPQVSAVVRKLAGNYVFVLGEVKSQGTYEIFGPMTVTQALARAGGPLSNAKLNSVLVIRRTAPDSITGIRVNVDRVLKNAESASDRVLRAYDIVYVPRTLIGQIDLFIERFFTNTVSPWVWYVWARNAIEWKETEVQPVPVITR